MKVPAAFRAVRTPELVESFARADGKSYLNPQRCPTCVGERWVCENHPLLPWSEEGCECGAGEPCPMCNPCSRDVPPQMPEGYSRSVATPEVNESERLHKLAWLHERVPGAAEAFPPPRTIASKNRRPPHGS